MKVDLLGAKCSPSAALIDHTVVPFVGLPASSVQLKTVPPHSWTSIPRCSLYQARSATGSFALKKIPPIPVTLFIAPPKCGQVGAYFVRVAPCHGSSRRHRTRRVLPSGSRLGPNA